MSRVELDKNANQYRVVIPLLKKLPPNPLIGGQNALLRAFATPSETEADSELSPEPRVDKTLRYQLLAYDQRSFLTGSAVADLQAAHIINTVRKNNDRKNEVQLYLTQQQFQAPHTLIFLLDEFANMILLESNLHIQWVLYGSFCIVPAEAHALVMLDALRKSNEKWRELADLASAPKRPLDVSEPPFNNPLWDIIILHPRALLPETLSLSIAENPYLYEIGQVAPSQHTWTQWTASGDRLCSASPPNEPLPPFTAKNGRVVFKKEPISSLAMVTNAHCKLQQFMREHGPSATPRIKRFATLISLLVTEIFFVPDGFPNVVVQGGFSCIPQQVQRTQTLRPSTFQATQMTGQSSVAEHTFGPTFGGMEETSAPSDEDRLSCLVEYPEVPDEDGLTDAEFQLVSAKARDSRLDGKERADAAMMMIFGTRRYVDPYVHGSPAVHGSSAIHG